MRERESTQAGGGKYGEGDKGGKRWDENVNCRLKKKNKDKNNPWKNKINSK